MSPWAKDWMGRNLISAALGQKECSTTFIDFRYFTFCTGKGVKLAKLHRDKLTYQRTNF